MIAEGVNRFWTCPDVAGLDLIVADFTDASFPRHTHDDFVIGLNVTGVEGFERCGSRYVSPAGTIVIINAGDVHNGYAANRDGWIYRGFYPTPEFMTEIAGSGSSVHFSDAVIEDDEVFRLLLAGHTALESGENALAATSVTLTALRELCRRYASQRTTESSEPPASSRLDRVLAVLLDRIDENVTLSELALAAGLSPFHLLRSFEERYGMPPHRYRTQYRVARARRMLAAGMSIAEAATSNGFTDQSHLTRWFKRIVGTTPAAYRNGVR